MERTVLSALFSGSLGNLGIGSSTSTATSAGRRHRVDDIRCDLLVDRDDNDRKLGLIDSQGFVSERALTEHKGGSRPPIRDALAALVARNVLSAIPARGYRVALVTKERLQQNKESGYDTVSALRLELQRIAEAACERFSTYASSTDERRSLLEPAREQLECAQEKARGNLQRDSGEAIFHCTETLGLVGAAAGLQWGPDNLRSGLDILEYSLRWNRDQQNQFPFDKREVNQRIRQGKEILDALTGKKVAGKKAETAFAEYLGDRIDLLSSCLEAR